MKDAMHVQENASMENMHEMDQQQVDDSLEFESKGIVRMSTKQVIGNSTCSIA